MKQGCQTCIFVVNLTRAFGAFSLVSDVFKSTCLAKTQIEWFCGWQCDNLGEEGENDQFAARSIGGPNLNYFVSFFVVIAFIATNHGCLIGEMRWDSYCLFSNMAGYVYIFGFVDNCRSWKSRKYLDISGLDTCALNWNGQLGSHGS